MKESILHISVCPKCGKSYHGDFAVSREDNKTHICPDCGTRESLASMGVEPDEQERILDIIHRSERGQRW